MMNAKTKKTAQKVALIDMIGTKNAEAESAKAKTIEVNFVQANRNPSKAPTLDIPIKMSSKAEAVKTDVNKAGSPKPKAPARTPVKGKKVKAIPKKTGIAQALKLSIAKVASFAEKATEVAKTSVKVPVAKANKTAAGKANTKAAKANKTAAGKANTKAAKANKTAAGKANTKAAKANKTAAGKANAKADKVLEAATPTIDKNAAPSLAQLEAELKRVEYKDRYKKTFRSTIAVLVVTAAVVVLLAFLIFPVFRIYGSSMSPTINEGEIVVSMKGSKFECGDVIVLSYNNKLLVKRVIAGPGDWFDMDRDGNVFVNGEQIDEPYLIEKAYGDCNITLPYQVPDGRYFVLGDNRATSQDSRNSLVGCIADEQIVGRALFRIWPLNEFGSIKYK